MKKLLLVVVFITGIVWIAFSLHEKSERDQWEVYWPRQCSFSSPRPVDLNGDGVMDLVLGAGRDEFQGSDTVVVAVDGINGEMIWRVPGRDQMVGSALFLDINRDQTKDVFMAGRAGQLMAVDGKNGELIWQYHQPSVFSDYPDSVFLNFYTPQLVPDYDQDGLQDLLISAGGDATIPHFDRDRPTGKLMLISSRDGSLLHEMMMPDKGETFMSPVCADLEGNGKLTIFFGTGGETLGGSFYRLRYQDFLANDLSGLSKLSSSEERGFIAPPVLADVNTDQVLDVVVNAVDGRMMAFCGQSDELLWELKIPGAEVYGSLAVGYFNEDDVPDFFSNFGVGVFPNVEKSYQLMVNGKNGEIEFMDSLGILQIGSPLAFDINQDGRHEAVMSVNWFMENMAKNYYESIFGMQNDLLIFRFDEPSSYRLLGPFKGANPAATPWIGDLDDDNKIDVVYSFMHDPETYRPFNGMKLLRKEFNLPAGEHISWGSYMGTDFTGVFRGKQKDS